MFVGNIIPRGRRSVKGNIYKGQRIRWGMVYKNILELVGNTPLIALNALSQEFGISGKLYAKWEASNPTGSVKDRAALLMLLDAERRGILKEGATIVEPTSGNFGVALAALGGIRGYHVVIVMPKTATEERKSLVRAYGAELILTDGSLGMRGAIERAEELCRAGGGVMLGQFSNPANPAAHEKTGEEIWADTAGEVDLFVAGVGTGGTLTGVARYLKQKKPAVRVIAVEPAGSPYLSEGRAGRHGIQGIGAGFVPAVLDKTLIDGIVTVEDGDALACTRALACTEGILAGISSGAALHAALLLGREYGGKNIVTILPDTGERYLSLFSKE